MEAGARSHLDVIAAIGLAVGGAFGMAGTFVPQDALRQELWAIDGVPSQDWLKFESDVISSL